jgi:hypothetical protein
MYNISSNRSIDSQYCFQKQGQVQKYSSVMASSTSNVFSSSLCSYIYWTPLGSGVETAHLPFLSTVSLAPDIRYAMLCSPG